MEETIEVFVHPPSPSTRTVTNDNVNERKGIGSQVEFPSINSLFSPTSTTTKNMPRCKLTIDTDLHHLSPISPILTTTSTTTTTQTLKKLDTIEPDLNKRDLSSSSMTNTSPLLLSSPSPSPSPLITPLSYDHASTTPQSTFLLPPPASFNRTAATSPSSATTTTATSSNTLDSPVCSAFSLSPLTLSSPMSSFAITTDHSEEDQLSLFPSLSEQRQQQSAGASIDDINATAPSTSTGKTQRSCSPSLQTRPVHNTVTTTGRTILKRKRGRPSTTHHPLQLPADHGSLITKNDTRCWTFVEPTVWNVKHNQREIDLIKRELQQLDTEEDPQVSTFRRQNIAASSTTTTYISTDLNMNLNIPKKKRGRKPKKQLVGNGCFVWKDLTAPRGANKKKQ